MSKWQHDLSNEQRRERDRKLWRQAFLFSLLVHVLILFLWRPQGPLLSPFSAAGPRNGDNMAAGGALQTLTLRIPTPRPIIPPRVPLATLEPIEPVEFEPEVEMDIASVLGERPGDEGPGVEEGEGEGDGGTADEGLFRLVPPSPRGMIMPPSNKSLKGKQIEVWVFVNEMGRVVADSTRLRPPTSDGSFNRRLLEEAAQWVFQPATKAGKAVASWFPYTISM